MTLLPIGTRVTITGALTRVGEQYLGKAATVIGHYDDPRVAHRLKFDDATLSESGFWSREALRPLTGEVNPPLLRVGQQIVVSTRYGNAGIRRVLPGTVVTITELAARSNDQMGTGVFIDALPGIMCGYEWFDYYVPTTCLARDSSGQFCIEVKTPQDVEADLAMPDGPDAAPKGKNRPVRTPRTRKARPARTLDAQIDRVNEELNRRLGDLRDSQDALTFARSLLSPEDREKLNTHIAAQAADRKAS